MKKTLLLTLIAGFASISLFADTAQDIAVQYREAREASGLTQSVFFASDADNITLAQEVATNISQGGELTPEKQSLLSAYAHFLYVQNEKNDAYAMWRLAQVYSNVFFIRFAITENEIIANQELLARPNNFRQIKLHAAPRLNKPELVTLIGNKLVGKGIVPLEETRANLGVNTWVAWFDGRVRELAQAGNFTEAITLLNNELIGLISLDDVTDDVKSRIQALEAQAAIYNRMASRVAN